jgi:hypothetical protein
MAPPLRLFATVLRTASIVAVVLVAAGLIGFLTDEVRNSSDASATRITIVQGEPKTVTIDITQPDPPPSVERLREQKHSSAREVIDDANDMLLRPFSWIAQESDPWVQRLLYSALALLIYGFLVYFLADRLHRLSEQIRREAISAAEARAAREQRESGTYVSPA